MNRRKFIGVSAATFASVALPSMAFAGNGIGQQLQDGSCIDWESLTTEEIHHIVDLGRNELTTRDLIAAENLVLVDCDDVQLYITGEYKMWGGEKNNKYLKLYGVFVNNSSDKIGVNVSQSYVNGWEAFCTGIAAIDGGKKARVELDVNLEDAGIESFEEIQDLELMFYTFNGDTYYTITDLLPVVVRFDVPEVNMIEKN